MMFDINKVWIYRIEDCACGAVIADNKELLKEKKKLDGWKKLNMKCT